MHRFADLTHDKVRKHGEKPLTVYTVEMAIMNSVRRRPKLCIIKQAIESCITKSPSLLN